jgi:hypothetical protein
VSSTGQHLQWDLLSFDQIWSAGELTFMKLTWAIANSHNCFESFKMILICSPQKVLCNICGYLKCTCVDTPVVTRTQSANVSITTRTSPRSKSTGHHPPHFSFTFVHPTLTYKKRAVPHHQLKDFPAYIRNLNILWFHLL